jgi:hypothetical protein
MSKYTNGEYTVEGQYNNKSIIVKLTLDNDTIQDVARSAKEICRGRA